MPKYLIEINTGYSPEQMVLTADNQDDADEIAYEVWREAAENHAEYSAELLTEDNCPSEFRDELTDEN